MVDQKDIFKIIEYGAMAPSADNNQPWYFQVEKNLISIYLDRRRQTIRDFSNKDYIVDLISIGTVLENMRIASLSLGYSPKTEYNNQHKDNLIATVALTKSEKAAHKLFSFIPTRATNRCKYKKNVIIEKNVFKEMEQIAEKKGGKIYFANSKKDIKKIAKSISYFDNILWLNPKKRKDLLKTIRWTNREAKNSRDGLALKALSLMKWQEKAFSLLAKLSQKYPFFFHLIRLSSKQNSYKLAKSSAGFFVVAMPNNDKENYVQGGQIFENIWLYLTSKKISCHPMVGPLFCFFYEFSPDGKNELTGRERKIVQKIVQNLREHFPVSEDNALICLCRFGYAKDDPLETHRRPIEELVQ
ncbi:hypothetical protein KJ854_06295 [Patescibacteria group bacterium]|nr:hypothetical protein [Patescibacteria group bacterium]MBU4141902.1 hypothetical protein [Patescibacteria group bacterium]